MRFDELEDKMRKIETANDRLVPQDIWFVARLDGRGFTKLADKLDLNRPFDINLNSHKNNALQHIMCESGFEIVYGYHQSDEVSLLFKKNTEVFNRKYRKYISLLSAEFSLAFQASLVTVSEGDVPFTSFDCRIIELPTEALVIDYFSWRMADASRNCLNTYCYWTARDEPLSPKQATKLFLGMSVADKHNYLYNKGINFAKVPGWQINGSHGYYVETPHNGWNPIKQEMVQTTHRLIFIDEVKIHGDPYRNWLKTNILDKI